MGCTGPVVAGVRRRAARSARRASARVTVASPRAGEQARGRVVARIGEPGERNGHVRGADADDLGRTGNRMLPAILSFSTADGWERQQMFSMVVGDDVGEDERAELEQLIEEARDYRAA